MQDFIERQTEKFMDDVVTYTENHDGNFEPYVGEFAVKSFLLSFQREMVERLEQEIMAQKSFMVIPNAEDGPAMAFDWESLKDLLSKMKQ